MFKLCIKGDHHPTCIWGSLDAAMPEKDEEVLWEKRKWPWLLVQKTELICHSNTSLIMCRGKKWKADAVISLYSPMYAFYTLQFFFTVWEFWNYKWSDWCSIVSAFCCCCLFYFSVMSH